jgi:hypothetical protein
LIDLLCQSNRNLAEVVVGEVEDLELMQRHKRVVVQPLQSIVTQIQLHQSPSREEATALGAYQLIVAQVEEFEVRGEAKDVLIDCLKPLMISLFH